MPPDLAQKVVCVVRMPCVRQLQQGCVMIGASMDALHQPFDPLKWPGLQAFCLPLQHAARADAGHRTAEYSCARDVVSNPIATWADQRATPPEKPRQADIGQLCQLRQLLKMRRTDMGPLQPHIRTKIAWIRAMQARQARYQGLPPVPGRQARDRPPVL